MGGHLVDIECAVKIILKKRMLLNPTCVGWDPVLVNTVMKLLFPLKAGNLMNYQLLK